MKNSLSEINTLYENCRDAIQPLPAWYNIFSYVLLILVFIVSFVEVLVAIYDTFELLKVWMILFLILVIFVVIYLLINRYNHKIVQHSSEQLMLLEEATNEIAEKYNTNQETLMIYLLSNHKPNVKKRVFILVFTIICISYAVIYIPAYHVEDGPVSLIIIIIMNAIISLASMVICDLAPDEFAYILIVKQKCNHIINNNLDIRKRS